MEYRKALYTPSVLLGSPDDVNNTERRHYWKRQLKGCMVSAIGYALGYKTYEDTLSAYPDAVGADATYVDQMEVLLKRAARKPRLVFEVGSGRGELAAALSRFGIPCIASDLIDGFDEVLDKTEDLWGAQIDGVQMDLTESSRMLGEWLPDTIILCETIEHIPRREFEEAWGVNVEGTAGLVELAKDEHLPLVFSSTCSNYGVTAGWATESTPLNPQGLYAKSKVEAERTVSQLYFHVVLRFSTLFGVSPRMRMDLMLNEWTKNLLFDGRVEVYQPDAHRPTIHVRDAARAVRGVLDGIQHAQNQTFNVGCNDYNFTKRALAELIRSEVGGDIIVVDKGDPRDYLVSFDKIRQVYGFHPRVTPAEGVREVRAFLESYSGAELLNNVSDYHDTSI